MRTDGNPCLGGNFHPEMFDFLNSFKKDDLVRTTEALF
jgi:hypothetical protein